MSGDIELTLQSMTGFARIEGANDDLSWVWELRSVNGKGLDIRLRVPPGFEKVEIPARKFAQAAFKRGNIQISLQISHKASQSNLTVDEAFVENLIVTAKRLQEKIGGDMPGVADLLSIRGVVEAEDPDTHAIAGSSSSEILESFSTGLKELGNARALEGGEIGKVLLQQISAIETMTAEIESDIARLPETIRDNLRQVIARLIADNSEFDEQRLHQEALLLATKADITEELDRLKVHVNSARELISKGGAIGRKLDFLAQEFNRECNTICSKSNASSVTTVGLDMKLVIDQFREQLQNME